MLPYSFHHSIPYVQGMTKFEIVFSLCISISLVLRDYENQGWLGWIATVCGVLYLALMAKKLYDMKR